ncbi:hypothetical protein [Paenibacillus tuaregi]|uniref:hypothetical protein n=1 Tax=Paenibacillus tuaregi TaxID=1816681 RepID=UPI000837E577|nr:hypothetical protein [Paenibacillus tuaregi]
MNSERREIILNEIEYWRTSRLLPEQYCDFLENLYQEQAAQAARRTFSINSIQQGSLKTWFLGFGIISLIFFIGFYFSLFPWPLQMAIALLVTSICYSFSAVFRPRRKVAALLTASGGSVILLGLGAWTLWLQDWLSPGGIAGLVGVCGLIWWLAGYFLNLGILNYCGFVCFILLYGVMFGKIHPDASWPMMQLFWLPLSVVMVWLCWLAHHRIKRMAPVFFAVGITVWFMPEADMLLMRQSSVHGMVLLCLLKIVIAFILLFVLRKKWIVWVFK